MDSIPQMRSGYFKYGVKALESLARAERERIFSSVAAETLQAIQQDVDIGWVPLRLNADFTEVVYRVLGPDVTRRSWNAVYRNCGEVEVDAPAGNSVSIRLVEAPPLMRTPSYVVSVTGGLEAIFDFCKVSGTITSATRARDIEWLAAW